MSEVRVMMWRILELAWELRNDAVLLWCCALTSYHERECKGRQLEPWRLQTSLSYWGMLFVAIDGIDTSDIRECLTCTLNVLFERCKVFLHVYVLIGRSANVSTSHRLRRAFQVQNVSYWPLLPGDITVL